MISDDKIGKIHTKAGVAAHGGSIGLGQEREDVKGTRDGVLECFSVMTGERCIS